MDSKFQKGNDQIMNVQKKSWNYKYELQLLTNDTLTFNYNDIHPILLILYYSWGEKIYINKY